MDARFRLFGFLRDDRRLSPTERDVLMATFGPAAVDIPEHGQALPQVEVAWLAIHSPQVCAESTETIKLCRGGAWQHPVRNRLITHLALDIRSDNVGRLRRYRDVTQWLRQHQQCPPRVTVLVENVEQAIALAEQLPGWPIAAGDQPWDQLNLRGISRSKRKLFEERRTAWLTGEQQIVTVAAAPRLGLAKTDVILWAGGGKHAPEIPRHWLQIPANRARHILVIDVQDNHHQTLAQWSQQRRTEYSKRDWFDVGVQPETGRVIRYLHQRPRPAATTAGDRS